MSGRGAGLATFHLSFHSGHDEIHLYIITVIFLKYKLKLGIQPLLKTLLWFLTAVSIEF